MRRGTRSGCRGHPGVVPYTCTGVPTRRRSAGSAGGGGGGGGGGAAGGDGVVVVGGVVVVVGTVVLGAVVVDSRRRPDLSSVPEELPHATVTATSVTRAAPKPGT